MIGTELAHARRVLQNLRDEVDDRLSSVVRSHVQGEGVAEGTSLSGDPLLEAIRCWPELGWPNQLIEEYTGMRIKPSDPKDPKNQAPGKH